MIIWQKGNKFLGWLYAIIVIVASLGLLQKMFTIGFVSDDWYGFIGVALFAFLSWYCFRPVPKGHWYKLEDGRRVFVEEKKGK